MTQDTNFWSRRREAVLAEEQAVQADADAQLVAQDQAALETLTDAEVLEKLELPDPDTLTLGDDFSAFMGKAVPEHIRRRALRVLWRSNPVLANVDMLVDYGEDFTDSATVIENMQTAYQVGKGMLKHVQEVARQAEERENPPPVDEIVEDELVADDDLIALADDAETPAAAPDFDDDEQEQAPTTPRRMAFRIEETV